MDSRIPRLSSLAALLTLGALLAGCAVQSRDGGSVLMLKPASPYATPAGYSSGDDARAAILFDP